MRIIERVHKLQQLINIAGGQIEGRKKIHKLIYLCQAAGIDFEQDFTFYLYGVYSPTLVYDIQWALEHGALTEQKIKNCFIIRNVPDDQEDQENDYLGNSKYDDINLLAEKKTQVLELLSTIVYLHTKGYLGNKLEQKLNQLKGHLLRFKNEAYELADNVYGIKL